MDKLGPCRHCGHTWIPRVPNPRRCPNCTSTTWARPRPEKEEWMPIVVVTTRDGMIVATITEPATTPQWASAKSLGSVLQDTILAALKP